jgi:release factor glutamine methyltransferase
MDRTLGGRTTVRDVLVDAEKRLAAVGVPSPSFDAAELVAYALGTTRSRLFLQDPLESDDRVRIEQLLARRLSRVPLQHLTGVAGFRRIEVAVGPGVFIPRPETELATEAGVRALVEAEERIAVDLCSGSGAIAISLGVEVPGSHVYAVEMSDDAVPWTRRNVEAHAERLAGVGSTVEVVHDDAGLVALPGRALARLAGRVAVVVTNPPYIPDGMLPKEPEVRDHEPRLALYGGSDGLDVVRAVVRTAAILLRPGGLLCVEHADIQGKAAGPAGVPGIIASLVADEDLSLLANVPMGRPAFTEVADRIDLNGLPRFTLARRT